MNTSQPRLNKVVEQNSVHPYALELININKNFGDFFANKNINLQIEKGTIHCVVGENGAGKTVLMSMLQGIYLPTVGTIKVNGNVAYINSAKKAYSLGIGMVQQHYQLSEIYKVWQNISLGAEITNFLGFTKKKATLKKMKNLSETHGIKLDFTAKTSSLSVTGKQKCEILKLLYRDIDILIFDEPTSILSSIETEKFLNKLQDLRNNGKTIIFISHKISEVLRVADKISTMRLGSIVKTYDASAVSEEQIKRDMFGQQKIKEEHKIHSPNKFTEIILELNNVSVNSVSHAKRIGLQNFDLKVKGGEIVGIAGIGDNGQNELYDVIIGNKLPTKGHIVFKQKNITRKSIHQRHAIGISRIPEDRNQDAIILDYQVTQNVALPNVGIFPFSKYGFMRYGFLENYTREIINKYDVKGAIRGFATMRWMSGGNQQKVVVGREMEREHSLLIMAQPSRGLDQKSIDFIHSQMLKERNANKGIIFISYDLEEIMKLSDRVIVLAEGRKIFEAPIEKTSYDEIATKIAILQQKQDAIKLERHHEITT